MPYGPPQLTIAQVVHDNERYFGLSEQDVHDKVGIHRSWGFQMPDNRFAALAHLGRHG